MNHDEVNEFIDQVAHGEARVKYHGVVYFCNGVSIEPSSGMFHVEIFPDEPSIDEELWRNRWWHYKGKSRDDCRMRDASDVLPVMFPDARKPIGNTYGKSA